MPPTLANPALWALTQGQILVWMMVMTRFTGLVAMLPGMGQDRVPVIIRAALVTLLAATVAPFVAKPAQMPTGIWDLSAYLVAEFAAGMLMGIVVAWIQEAVGFAGQLMDTQMGFSYAQIVDPSSGQPASPSGTLLLQLSLVFLFVSGLHHQMIRALIEGYRLLPIGQGLPSHPKELILLLGLILVRGFQLAAPVLFTLFLVDALEGISSRFMPQLQLIQLSFALKIGVGLVIMGVLLREFLAWLEPLFQAAPREALRLLA